jgi:hypothetical protein
MPHVDVGPEAEFAAMAPEGVTIHATRVRVTVVVPGAATAAIAALSRYAAEDGHRPPRDLSEIGSDTERLSRNNVDLSVAVVTMISLTA